MRQAAAWRPTARSRNSRRPNPFDNPFGKVLKDMFGGGAAAAARAAGARQNACGDNPFGKIFEEMLGGGHAAQPSPSRKQQPRAARQSERTAAATPMTTFGKMFETGRKSATTTRRAWNRSSTSSLKGMDRPIA